MSSGSVSSSRGADEQGFSRISPVRLHTVQVLSASSRSESACRDRTGCDDSMPIARVLAPTPPWEISQPVSIDDRIYAWPRIAVKLSSSAGTRLWKINGRLEPARDSEIRSTSFWTITVARPVVYAVGSDIHALEATRGLPLRWRFSGSASDEIAARTGNNRSNGTRGRVQATSGTLVVPGDGDVVILAAEDGSVLDVLETEDTSNPVLLESQLILAGNDRVSSLMQVGRADYRERIRENPDQPSRVLGLMELGVRGRSARSKRLDLPSPDSAPKREWAEGSTHLDASGPQSPDCGSENCLNATRQYASPASSPTGLGTAFGRGDRDGLLLIELLGDAGMSTVLIPGEGSARARPLLECRRQWLSAVTLGFHGDHPSRR